MNRNSYLAVTLVDITAVFALAFIFVLTFIYPKVVSAQDAKSVTVDGRVPWTDTTIDLEAGMTVEISAPTSGKVNIATRGYRYVWVGANGDSSKSASSPVPEAGLGALIGKIVSPDGKESKPFVIGARRTLTIQQGQEGRLWLGINEDVDGFGDNRGAFAANIRGGKAGGLQSESRTQANNASANDQNTSKQQTSVEVDARTPWTDTGIDVERGMVLEFSTDNIINTSVIRRVDADGDKSKAKPDLPLSNAAAGSLIAKIRYSKGGESKVVLIGKRGKISVEAGESGRLLLGVNDDNLKDNFGAFAVSIRFDKPSVLAATENDIAKPSGKKQSNSATVNNQANTVIIVPAIEPWTDTGIELPFETKIELSATGEITFDTWQGGSFSTKPDGDLTKRKRVHPVPSAGAGALIAKFSNSEGAESKPVFLGKGGVLQASLPGNNRLFLGINDDNLKNNWGEFSVIARIIGQSSLAETSGPPRAFAYRFPYDLIEMGIVVDRVSASDMNRLNLSTNEGFIVRESRTQGILKDDVINAIEDKGVKTLDEIRSFIGSAKANSVNVTVTRVPSTGLLVPQKQTIAVPRVAPIKINKLAQLRGISNNIYFGSDPGSPSGLILFKNFRNLSDTANIGIADINQGKIIKSATIDIFAANRIVEILSLNNQIYYLTIFSNISLGMPYKLQLISAENGKVVFSRETESCTGPNSRPTVTVFDGTPYVSIFPICSGDVPYAKWLYSLEDGKVVGRFKGDTPTQEIAKAITASNLQASAKYKILSFPCHKEDKTQRCRLSYVQLSIAENDDPYVLSIYLRGKKIHSENFGASISGKINYRDSGIIGSYKVGNKIHLLCHITAENEQNSLFLSYSFDDSLEDQTTPVIQPKMPIKVEPPTSPQATSQSSGNRATAVGAKSNQTTDSVRTSGRSSKSSLPTTQTQSKTTPANLDNEALKEGKAKFGEFYSICNESWFTRMSGRYRSGYIIEFKGVSFVIAKGTLSEADKLNGYEWRGRVILRAKAHRLIDNDLSRKHAWEDGGEDICMASKVNGQWSVEFINDNVNRLLGDVILRPAREKVECTTLAPILSRP